MYRSDRWSGWKRVARSIDSFTCTCNRGPMVFPNYRQLPSSAYTAVPLDTFCDHPPMDARWYHVISVLGTCFVNHVTISVRSRSFTLTADGPRLQRSSRARFTPPHSVHAQRSHGQVPSEDGASEGACRDSHPCSVGGVVDPAGAAQKGGRK